MIAIADCNNFYASCERVFRPSLNNLPVIVVSNNDGCVIALSQEAKNLGIKMGEPTFKVEQLLKQHKVEIFSSNYTLYGDLSDRVMKVLTSFCPDIEYYSIDEAFLNLKSFHSHFELQKYCEEIRQVVKQNTGIPISIGVAPSKVLAKMDNRVCKRQKLSSGVLVISDFAQIDEYLKVYDVEDIWGIGRQYSLFLKKNGINTGLDLKNVPDDWAKNYLTVVGLRIVEELRGKNCIPLEYIAAAKKANCTSRAFGKPLTNLNEIKEATASYAFRCSEKLRKQNSSATYITTFLQTHPFKENYYCVSKTFTMPVATSCANEIIKASLWTLKKLFKPGLNYYRSGVMVSGLVPSDQLQYNLFFSGKMGLREKADIISGVMDKVNKSMGREIVRIGAMGFEKKWIMRREKLSPCYTTKWSDIIKVKL